MARQRSGERLKTSRADVLGQEDPSHGSFSGEPQVKWLTAPEGEEDRCMALLEKFSFTDPDGKPWVAELGYRTDGASIPKALWSFVGSPFTGNYRRAAIVHDIACANAGNDAQKRLAADEMFYHACRTGGCSWYEALLLYIGVRIGAILPVVQEWRAAQLSDRGGPRLHLIEAEERMQKDFLRIAERVLSQGEVDDAKVIVRRTRQALQETIAPQRKRSKVARRRPSP